MIIGSNVILANNSFCKGLYHYNSSDLTPQNLANGAKSPYSTISAGGVAVYKFTNNSKFGISALSNNEMTNRRWFGINENTLNFGTIKYPVLISFWVHIVNTPSANAYIFNWLTLGSESALRVFLSVQNRIGLLIHDGGIIVGSLNHSSVLSTNIWYYVNIYIISNYAYIGVNNVIVGGSIGMPISNTSRMYMVTCGNSTVTYRASPVYVDELQFKMNINYPISQLTLEKNRES